MGKIKYLLLALAFVMAGCAATAPESGDGIPNKMVIQVSTDDPRTQMIALNNAVNLQKALGPGNVHVEIVAYGPGLSLLTKNSKQARRVAGLALYDEITFSACNNTMKKIKRKRGRMPKLIEGVEVVPAGVTRIMELQQQGYTYLRP